MLSTVGKVAPTESFSRNSPVLYRVREKEKKRKSEEIAD